MKLKLTSVLEEPAASICTVEEEATHRKIVNKGKRRPEATQ
jgi:hypothetical protein